MVDTAGSIGCQRRMPWGGWQGTGAQLPAAEAGAEKGRRRRRSREAEAEAEAE